MDRAEIIYDRDFNKLEQNNFWRNWFKWLPTSNTELIEAERMIFKRLGCNLDTFFVPIFASSCYLRTIVARNRKSLTGDSVGSTSDSKGNVPLVLIHGFVSGCALWCKNIDSLSKFRSVYAFDLIGFGRSSRPDFPKTAEEVEEKFVQAIEEWRLRMEMDKFILVGHSMGGFLATSYALRYPERIAHLILVDPWGFVGREEDTNIRLTGARGWIFNQLSSFRALSALRFLGPFGPKAFRSIRPDFKHVFYQIPEIGDEVEIGLQSESGDEEQVLLQTSEQSMLAPIDSTNEYKHGSKQSESPSPFDSAVIYNYMYHINAQFPSGEDAFLRLSSKVGWADRPMLDRVHLMNTFLPISFIYGERSWIDMNTGLRVKSMRPESYVDVMVINGAGHHVYAQHAEEFNAYVNAVAGLVDQGHEFRPGSEKLVRDLLASRDRVGNLNREDFIT